MGLYMFTHMPFGLSNAGFSFCCLMEQCLGDQQFDRLKKFNLKIKPKKCQFFSTSVLFLGHVLWAEGISANPEKVEKVKNWPVPKNTKQMQSFLELASYYRQFIPHFAKKA